jgi:hypothetical protein
MQNEGRVHVIRADLAADVTDAALVPDVAAGGHREAMITPDALADP